MVAAPYDKQVWSEGRVSAPLVVVVPVNVSTTLLPILFRTFPGSVLPRCLPVLSAIISSAAVMIFVRHGPHVPVRLVPMPESFGEVAIRDRLPGTAGPAAAVPPAFLAGIIAIAGVDQIIGNPHRQRHSRGRRQHHDRGRGNGDYWHHRQGQAKVDSDAERGTIGQRRD